MLSVIVADAGNRMHRPPPSPPATLSENVLSVIVAESRRALDESLLPDFSAWDIRRYGGTQIAIRTVLPRSEPTSSAFDPQGGGSDDGNHG